MSIHRFSQSTLAAFLACLTVSSWLWACDSNAKTGGGPKPAPLPATVAQAAATVPPTPGPPASAVTPKVEAPEAVKNLSHAFASTAKAVRPCVVRLDVEQAPKLSRGKRGDNPFLGQLPPELRRFFDFGESPMPELSQPTPVVGTGSGFVLDGGGDIITNSHVVEDGAKFEVTFFDGQEIGARVIGKDTRTDVAVVRLDTIPKNLTMARLGDSNTIEVGQWVLAVGSPLGLDQTVTAGIISGKGRVGRNVQMSGDRVRDYIQTDAKINPGNSGGPLVNLDGEVVGMNTLIRVGAGGAYGFAVPINEVYRVAELLIKDGKIRYPFLGVSLRDVSQLEDARQKLGPNAPQKGALVVEVTEASPAAKVGIRPGDVITKLDDHPVADAEDVVLYVSNRTIGEPVNVTINRDGGSKTFKATLSEAPSEDGKVGESPQLGLSLQSLTPSLAESLGLPQGMHGAAVTDVSSGSPAEKAGLRTGDVIVEVDHKTVASAEEAANALKGTGKRYLLRVRGPQGFRFVTLGG